jgi:hypothetical protein
MTQISRPFQIAIAVVALFGAVWAVALRGHSSSSPEPSAPKAAAKSSSAPNGSSAGAPSKIYHGAAPGVEGLSRAVAKAHGAVATSEQNAKQLQEKSAEASSANPTSASSSSSSSSSSRAGGAAAPATKSVAPAKSSTHPARKGSSPPASHHAGALARQKAVEAELAHGRVVALLFWSKSGADDKAVHAELQLLAKIHHGLRAHRSDPRVRRLDKTFGLELAKPIAVHEAGAGQVASFGSFTRGVQVFGTPTLLVIGKTGKTITLTGFQDAYSIEQTIDEVRHA